MGQNRFTRHARKTASRRRKRTMATSSAIVAGLLLGSAVVGASVATEAGATSTNLVRDPGFRHARSAWTVSRHTHVWTTSYGHAGHRSLGVRNLSARPRTIRLNDRRNTVARTVAGTTYTATAWVRVAQKRTTAAIRESAWRGAYVRGTPARRAVPLRDHRWHQVRVTYRATATSNTVALNIFAYNLPPRATFYISQVSLIARRAPVTPPVTSRPTPGQLVFDDEFDGSSVDRSKWRVRNDTWGTNEYSILTSRPQNVFVSGGVLTIRAQRERYTAYSMTRDYTSGYLDTIGLHSQQYGRWEMRAKLPTAKGLWPAFWLRSDHTPGEIDILESIGGLDRMTSQTVLESTTDHSVKQTHTYNVTGTIADWHVYGFTWTPTSMSWDIDGVTVFTVRASDYAWSAGAAFRDTMNIRLNLQVGGDMPAWWNSDVDASTPFPADYQIDWVRAYAG